MNETTRGAGRRAAHPPCDDPLTKAAACDVIAARMSGRSWDADCTADVADTLRRAGYTVREPDDCEPCACDCSPCIEPHSAQPGCCARERAALVDEIGRALAPAARPHDPRADAPEAALNARDVAEYLGGRDPREVR